MITSGEAHMTRTDRACRIIAASPETLYRAFIDPDKLSSWLPPKGMSAQIHVFEPRIGGRYRMSLVYEGTADHTRGKSSADEDIVEGEFVLLEPNERVVQRVTFASDDPSFAGTMTMTWSLAAAPGGTEVTIVCEDVPPGIRKEDHDVGLRSSLENLAAFTE